MRVRENFSRGAQIVSRMRKGADRGLVRAFVKSSPRGLGGLGDDLCGLVHHRHGDRREHGGGGDEAIKFGHLKLPENWISSVLL